MYFVGEEAIADTDITQVSFVYILWQMSCSQLTSQVACLAKF